MSNYMYATVLLIALIVTAGVLLIKNRIHISNEQVGGGFTYGKKKDCKYSPSVFKRLQQVTDMTYDDKIWDVYFPCGYNNAQGELAELLRSGSIERNGQQIFMLDGHDNISRKDTLWKLVRDHYGLSAAVKLVPNTYILSDPADIARLKKDAVNSKNGKKDGKSSKGSNIKVYIMKKNIQRQEGLKLTKDIDEIISNATSSNGGGGGNFVVTQEVLQNPHMINGHKTNCRVYLLLICRYSSKSSKGSKGKSTLEAYIYNDGFMYYTPKKFKAYSLDPKEVITTGYIDRAIYDENPLTLKDWMSVEPRGQISKAGKLLKKILAAVELKICNANSTLGKKLSDSNSITFQVFGCDLAYDNNYEPMLIEINKGPDLGAKDARDKELKESMFTDIFKVLQLIDGTTNFVKIL